MAQLRSKLAMGVGLLLGGIAEASTITGQVPLPVDSASPAVMAKRYELVSKGGILSPIPPVAVVWAERAGDHGASRQQNPETDGSSKSQIRLAMVQQGLVFDPALLPVQVGTVVEFPNLDDEYHNVFSYSPTQRFDLGRYMPEERPVPSQRFDTPGTVIVRCDIHEHMRAIILVLDSAHFTTTDTGGFFRLENVPSGDWVLKAWIDTNTTLEMPLKIEEQENEIIVNWKRAAHDLD